MVINFWATWCPSCRYELPMLDRLATQYAGRDIVIIAASIDDPSTQPIIPRFLAKKKITLPIWLNATTDTLSQMHLGGVIPATILIDRNGEPFARILGEASRKDICSRLDWLLGDRSAKPPKPLLRNY
ncbi:MAG: hypothetical protein NVS9B13_26300 [Candidatus Acidiferrum sp.]